MSSPWTALSYDALDRLASIDSSVDTNFAHDGLDMIAEYDPSGAIQARYVHGPGTDQPLVRYDGSGTGNKTSLHSDERGSITARTRSPVRPCRRFCQAAGQRSATISTPGNRRRPGRLDRSPAAWLVQFADVAEW